MRGVNPSPAVAVILALISSTNGLISNSSINSQVRLAYAGPNGMTVSWNTFQHIDTPTVLYGFSAAALKKKATSDVSVTYPTSLTYNNHVKITGLEPDTLYYYLPTSLIKSNETVGPFTFKTSKPAGHLEPYSIAVVVDMGTMGPEGLFTSAGKGVAANNILKPGEINTIQSLTAAVDEFEFLWHPGDIAYADTWLKEELQGFEPNATIHDGYKVYESILNGYYDEMTPITAKKAYMVGPGNHEANCDNGGTGGYNASICLPGQTNFTGYINHFRMPSPESGGTGNFWYSFDYGMTHFVQFDTETDLGPYEPAGGTEDSGPFALMNAQANWLAADLAAVDRNKTPWVVVAGHRPWYSSGSVCTPCQEAFEDVFVQNNVDLVLSGHFHVYERNTPIKNGTADPSGLNNPSSPWYITNGAAGHYDGLDSFTLPLESYQQFGLSTADGIYGWSKLTFHNCTHLTHQFINSANSSVLDTATLFKNRKCASGTNSNSSVTSLPITSTSSPTSTQTSISASTTPSFSTTSGSSVSLTTSVIYTTTLITVTSCAATVTSCSARSPTVITSTIALYTTVCPVSAISTTSTESLNIKVVTSTLVPTSPLQSGSAQPAASKPTTTSTPGISQSVPANSAPNSATTKSTSSLGGTSTTSIPIIVPVASTKTSSSATSSKTTSTTPQSTGAASSVVMDKWFFTFVVLGLLGGVMV